jgi:hypothetical protein
MHGPLDRLFPEGPGGEDVRAELYGRAPDGEELARSLDELDARNRRRALDRPPTGIVAAYREVYGAFPAGWPPSPTGDG